MNGKCLRGLALVVAAATLLVSSSSAWAVPLLPGTAVNPNAGALPVLGGNVIANTGYLPGTTVEDSGLVREIVVKGDANNALGGLDFIYQLVNNAASASPLSALNTFSYKGFLTDVSALTSGAAFVGTTGVNGVNSFIATGPSGTPTNAARGFTGSQVSFNFGLGNGLGSLLPGDASDILIIRTNAQSMTSGIMDFNDGGTSNQLKGFAPLAPVPEPSSLVLLGGCLAGLGARVWRRRKNVTVVS